jgi:phosphatidylglycerophosphate synthase
VLYLADLLSLLRIILTSVVVFLGLTDRWEAAFSCLVIAWITDLLDGMAARKFGSLSHDHELDADGAADSVLAYLSAAMPVVYYGMHTGWHSWLFIVLACLYASTLISTVWMLCIMNIEHKTPLQVHVLAFQMIVVHAVLQIGATIVWFAYKAHGIGFAGFVGAALVIVLISQKRKLLLWWNGRLA